MLSMGRLPADGIVTVRMSGPLTMDHAASLQERLEQVKREQGSRVSFVMLPGNVSMEALSDADLARFGLQRIQGAAC